ncbi:hypothetical protein LI168_14185 [Desulfovibrio desulfuricans]|uniref:hypothetical protein n=1 Tax=Desulfovibrio desulfuricans TaxID=876 RepID=UPI001D082C9F|nr:hypothetical protein [Desulfovibrio desulfuricans]MCB6543267.1 hypothetical protein [Desulfovibrio desulfuricans]MCB6554366.1 hypothetical protein [Desulfovibrio desulfuricans]MCB6566207.1 hypothetical protein [Desulfovibrio desulfuricans]MCB7347367.1 hypothetical protein [Desulfovibrio desulfuricans]MCQ5217576.1 hypothetical protein [Desulfovibrio desulfuricans]
MIMINSDATTPTQAGKAVEVEIFSPEFSPTVAGDQITETLKNAVLSAVNGVTDTSREKLDRVNSISIKTKFRFEIVPENMEVSITLKS